MSAPWLGCGIIPPGLRSRHVFSFLRRGSRDERLEQGVQKTRSSFLDRLSAIFQPTPIGEQTWDDLEEALIGADVGIAATERIIQRLRQRYQAAEFGTGEELRRGLAEELILVLRPQPQGQPLLPEALAVVLVVGVNGVGKTTTIAKLGKYWREQGRSVLLAAGDTFRAAATEQLELWAER